MIKQASSTAVASVVIPAHNEEKSIGRLLSRITAEMLPGEFEILVVCNGCTDRTAAVAAEFRPPIRVIEHDRPSKYEALRLGDQASNTFPRVYVDADVELGTNDIRALAHALDGNRILACAPERRLSRASVDLLPEWYYDVWEQLPQVREGLFGRGVIALSKGGHQRVAKLPLVLSDDLAMSEAFTADERAVVTNSYVVVHPARTLRELLRRRVRVATGNTQVDRHGLRRSDARTSPTRLLRLASRNHDVAARLPVFLAVTAIARWQAGRQVRSGDFVTWQRDESSRLCAD